MKEIRFSAQDNVDEIVEQRKLMKGIRFLTQNDVDEIVEQHKLWVNSGNTKGQCADFTNTRIEGVSFRDLDLRLAIFHNASICNSHFSNVDISYADFRNSYVSDCGFTKVTMFRTLLGGSNFCSSTFTACHFIDTSIINAQITNIDFYGVMFEQMNFSVAAWKSSGVHGCQFRKMIDISEEAQKGITADVNNDFYYSCCPEEGSFIGFKKAKAFLADGERDVIVKLLIPDDAKRSSACSRKCRASKAKVLKIYDLNRNELPDSTIAFSTYENNFLYAVDRIVYPRKQFDLDRWCECASGIHFFLSFNEAVNY